MALYFYHYEIYAARIGNKWYVPKPLGSPVAPDEKFIFGWLMTSIVLLLIVGPLILFSDLMPGLVGMNPVLSADVNIFMNMNETRYSDIQGNVLNRTTLEDYDQDQFVEDMDNGLIVASNLTTPY